MFLWLILRKISINIIKVVYPFEISFCWRTLVWSPTLLKLLIRQSGIQGLSFVHWELNIHLRLNYVTCICFIFFPQSWLRSQPASLKFWIKKIIVCFLLYFLGFKRIAVKKYLWKILLNIEKGILPKMGHFSVIYLHLKEAHSFITK